MALTVRTRVRRAVKSGLEAITLAAGYRKGIARVYDPPVNIKNLPKEFPAVNLLWPRETMDEIDLFGNEQVMTIHAIVGMAVVISEHRPDRGGDPALEQDQVLADIQEYFGRFPWTPDTDGNATTFTALYRASEPWGTEDTLPTCGIDIEYEFVYRQRVNNPEAAT